MAFLSFLTGTCLKVYPWCLLNHLSLNEADTLMEVPKPPWACSSLGPFSMKNLSYCSSDFISKKSKKLNLMQQFYMSCIILIYPMKTTGTNQCQHNQPQTPVSKWRLIGSKYVMQYICKLSGGTYGANVTKPHPKVNHNERNILTMWVSQGCDLFSLQ